VLLEHTYLNRPLFSNVYGISQAGRVTGPHDEARRDV
jgi:hypothetical protein